MRRLIIVSGLVIACCATSLSVAQTPPVGNRSEDPIPSVRRVEKREVARENDQLISPRVAQEAPAPIDVTGQISTRAAGDSCAEAILITCNSETSVDLLGTTPANPPYTCGGGSPGFGAKWFKFVAVTTDAIIETCGASTASAADTLLDVWSGACGSLTLKACDDDGCGGVGVGSRVSLTGLTPGQTYYIRVAKWNSPVTYNGTYTLSVQCCLLNPPEVTPQPGDQYEWETAPCGSYPNTVPFSYQQFDINAGCDADVPEFTEILECNSSVYGTYTMQVSPRGYTYRDTDWYRFSLETPGYITWSVQGPLGAVAMILASPDPAKPIACDDGLGNPQYGIGDIAEVTGCVDFVATATWPDPTGPAAPAGTYWLFVAPSFDNLWRWDDEADPCTKAYRATLTVTPDCLEQLGACCLTGTCTETLGMSACRAQGGTWYGAGSSCLHTTCFQCPAGYTELNPGPNGDDVWDCTQSPYTFTDTVNGGCNADNLQPDFTTLSIGTGTAGEARVCGRSGTYFDTATPNTATANLRDEDWFIVGNTLAGEWPVNVIKQLTIEVTAEFDVEVKLIKPGPLNDECNMDAAFETRSRVLNTVFAAAGETATIVNAIRSESSGYGRAWVLVRPAHRGTPREVPCGSRYSLRVAYVNGCTELGACCDTDGCSVTTLELCRNAGGWYAGPNTDCTNVCCPCESSDTPENEIVCEFPDSYNSSCWGKEDPNDPGFTMPIAIDQTICGKGSFVPIPNQAGFVTIDRDCYEFTVTEVSDIEFEVYSEFDFEGYVMVNPDPNNCLQASYYPAMFGAGEKCERWVRVFTNAEPGTYQFCVWMSFDSMKPYSCGGGLTGWPQEQGRYQLQVRLPGPSGACCYVEGMTSYCAQARSAAECDTVAGVFRGLNTGCDDPNFPDPCNGACCLPDGSCQSTIPTYCTYGLNGEFVGIGIVCGAETCSAAPTGACCAADGTCSLLSELACTTAGGSYLGNATLCTPNPCPPPTGACCRTLGVCEIATAADCATVGGTYQGNLTTCTPNPCPQPVICRGDANCSNNVDWRDIDYFVAGLNDNQTGWAARFPAGPTCLYANLDCNADGHVNWRDIDPFVARLNKPCP